MDLFNYLNLSDYSLESTYNMGLGGELLDSGIDSMTENWLNSDLENDGVFHNSLTENTEGDVSFKGHLEDLYNPEIQRAQDSYETHMSQLADSSNLSDMKYHLEKAESSKATEQFFHDCLEEAIRNQAMDNVRLDSITNQAEIAKQYEQEIENIISQNK